MAGWESVIAALGGLLVGIGIGMLLGRKRELTLRRRLTTHATELRSTVIPILEEHADKLGLPDSERCQESSNPLELTVRLSRSLGRHAEAQELPFDDTMELGNDVVKKALEETAK